MDLFEQDRGNPLLKFLFKERTFVEMAEDLQKDPRGRWPRPFGLRPESHILEIKRAFYPTQPSIELAMSAQSMAIASLRARDPRIPLNRQRFFHLAAQECKGYDDNLDSIDWVSNTATGLAVIGPPGVSKSATLTAFCSLFPQYFEHGANEECGWISLLQLIWLKVSLPEDADRRTLYLAIIQAIDKALGTKYAETVPASMRKGPLLLKAIKLLNLHRCGFLILEEAQAANLAPIVLGKEFAGGFLRILNSGIPLILDGNPLAFENILSDSANLRRLVSEGKFEFMPAYDEEDPMFGDLVFQLWPWTIFDSPDEEFAGDLKKFLYERTGGTHSNLVTYRSACLLSALRRGARRVERLDLEIAWMSNTMKPLHKLIKGYVEKDINLLEDFPDQPKVYLLNFWAETKANRKRRAEAAA